MGTLQIKSLSKSFSGRPVLENIELTIGKGEFVTILGPSGSGKSTLFHLIGGLLKPEHGAIMLNDEEITQKRGHISYMPQQPALFPWRTILENVMLGQEIVGKREEEKAREMMKRAGLSGYESAYPHSLSGGMKQRASFIRALLSPQSIICLDEPFSALDDFTRQDMHEWLLSIWTEYKKTILFVTHNMDEALFLSDRIVILSTNPARIIHEVQVPFTRPRTHELLWSPEFLEQKKQMSQWIKRGEKDANHH